MISMKMSDEEKKEYGSPSLVSGQSDYPYGLCLTLDDEQLESLGINDLPEAGKSMVIQARVLVTNVNQRPDDDDDGKPEATIQLQITDMEIGPDRQEDGKAKRLYSGD